MLQDIPNLLLCSPTDLRARPNADTLALDQCRLPTRF